MWRPSAVGGLRHALRSWRFGVGGKNIRELVEPWLDKFMSVINLGEMISMTQKRWIPQHFI